MIPSSKRRGSVPFIEWTMMAVASALLLVAAWLRWLPLAMTEVLGFVTGGVCVWLVVRENVWNWPIGLANNILFFILFLRGRLFADMGLQAVYFALGVYGWWHWLYGGERRTALRIGRATRSIAGSSLGSSTRRTAGTSCSSIQRQDPRTEPNWAKKSPPPASTRSEVGPKELPA